MKVVQTDLSAPTTAEFVRIEEDGTEFRCSLPTERHFNDGTGALYWKNRGFTPLAEYEQKKHAAEVEKRQAEERAKLEEEKKQFEAEKAAAEKKHADEESKKKAK